MQPGIQSQLQFPNILQSRGMRKRRSVEVDPRFESRAETNLETMKGARVRRRFPLAYITRIDIEKTNLMNRVGIRVWAEKKHLRLQVLEREMPNLARALELRVPGRAVKGRRISYRVRDSPNGA
jgi:hypothetical protein